MIGPVSLDGGLLAGGSSGRDGTTAVPGLGPPVPVAAGASTRGAGLEGRRRRSHASPCIKAVTQPLMYTSVRTGNGHHAHVSRAPVQVHEPLVRARALCERRRTRPSYVA